MYTISVWEFKFSVYPSFYDALNMIKATQHPVFVRMLYYNEQPH